MNQEMQNVLHFLLNFCVLLWCDSMFVTVK